MDRIAKEVGMPFSPPEIKQFVEKMACDHPSRWNEGKSDNSHVQPITQTGADCALSHDDDWRKHSHEISPWTGRPVSMLLYLH